MAAEYPAAKHRSRLHPRSLIASSGLLVAAACLLGTTLVHAQAASGSTDEVTVVGERPGPEMWKVTSGDHTIWLLGVLSPLPKHMTWRSSTVEAVVADSELVIPTRPSVKIAAGPFALIGLYFNWRRTAHLADGKTLREVVPEPLYARFEKLRETYAPHDSSLERLRPIAAAQQLYEKAVSASGLTADDDVESTVLKLARKHKVAVHEDVLTIENPKELLAELRAIPVESELKCFEATVARLETDLPSLRQRAVAWAVGDVESLRSLPSESRRLACWEAVELSPRLRLLAEAARAQRARAIDGALAEHGASVALVYIDQLLAPDGLLARLRAKGYVVDGP